MSKSNSALPAGEEHVVKWKDISVGDVVRVCDDELFPADLLCLDTGLADGVCFIRTTNLDGESNLKIRKSVDLRSISESYTLPETSTPQVRYCRIRDMGLPFETPATLYFVVHWIMAELGEGPVGAPCDACINIYCQKYPTLVSCSSIHFISFQVL